MRSYFALQGNTIIENGWQGCIAWSVAQLMLSDVPVKILTARPGSKRAQIVAEITPDGIRHIYGGRTLSIRTLRKIHGNSQ